MVNYFNLWKCIVQVNPCRWGCCACSQRHVRFCETCHVPFHLCCAIRVVRRFYCTVGLRGSVMGHKRSLWVSGQVMAQGLNCRSGAEAGVGLTEGLSFWWNVQPWNKNNRRTKEWRPPDVWAAGTLRQETGRRRCVCGSVSVYLRVCLCVCSSVHVCGCTHMCTSLGHRHAEPVAHVGQPDAMSLWHLRPWLWLRPGRASPSVPNLWKHRQKGTFVLLSLDAHVDPLL